MSINEHDTRIILIDPVLENSGWSSSQIRREYQFTDGEVQVHGNHTQRGSTKRADYVLFHKGNDFPLAVVEAKRADSYPGKGIQQAMNYAEILGSPFAYSTNGQTYTEHDFTTGLERTFTPEEFPSDSELWGRWVKHKGFDSEAQHVISQGWKYDDMTSKEPRYYQRRAVDAALEAAALGKRRILLVMATGTGKTFTAFQIIWRLRKAGRARRVLYLADRNILLDQTITGDFAPFSNMNIITKVAGHKPDRAYEIFMCLYQQLFDPQTSGRQPYESFSGDFFDLIIVDECHRGSADANSQWRRILEYFSPAVQIGMTATPKETGDVSNSAYFGEAVYTYSLKQGIEDGFLAPYKVIRVGLNVDLEGWRPEAGKTDIHGQLVEDREYTVSDFDKKIVLEDRTKQAAEHITRWLKDNGRDSKTIIFCADIEHAERMRLEMNNFNADITRENPEYIARITGDAPKSDELAKKFADAEKKAPVIATTSELLTTGVDARTVKLIVLDCQISSITKFKQIVGRGTRLDPMRGKEYFTIMDFRGACSHFADPDFDGQPLSTTYTPPDEKDPKEAAQPSEPRQKVYVNGVAVWILHEVVQYIDSVSGKLITEDIRSYTRRNILGKYSSLHDFISIWNNYDSKEALIEELKGQGVFLDILRSEAGEKAEGIDDFDLIIHTAYDVEPKTRRERAEHARHSSRLSKYSQECRKILEALLDKYIDTGISELESVQVLNTSPFRLMGTRTAIMKLFGGWDKYVQTVRELTQIIYEAA